MPPSHFNSLLFATKLVAVDLAETIVFVAFVVLETVYAIRFVIGLLRKPE